MFHKRAWRQTRTAVTGSQNAVKAGLSTESSDPSPRRDGVAQRFVDRCELPPPDPRAGAARTVLATVAPLVAAYVVASATLIGAGLVLVHWLHAIDRGDERMNAWVAGHRTPALDVVAHWGTFLANTMGVVVVATIVTIVLLVRRWGRVALLLPAGLAVELATFLTVNYTVGRPRPTVAHLGSTPTTSSFPSGHAAATLVLYGGIAVLVRCATRRRAARATAWTVAVVVPLWVACSRVYQGQHHPLDVVAGLAMGLFVLAAAVVAVRSSLSSRTPRSPRSSRSSHSKPAVAPTVTARGQAVVARTERRSAAARIGVHR